VPRGGYGKYFIDKIARRHVSRSLSDPARPVASAARNFEDMAAEKDVGNDAAENSEIMLALRLRVDAFILASARSVIIEDLGLFLHRCKCCRRLTPQLCCRAD